MTTWRDIADQLSPKEVELLEWLEGDPLNGLLAKPEQHLMFARGWATENLEQSLYADVPPPADATEVGPWRKSPDGVRRREFRSVTGVVGIDIAIECRGVQYTDGRIEARMVLTGDSPAGFSPAEAREMATALLKFADDIEAG